MEIQFPRAPLSGIIPSKQVSYNLEEEIFFIWIEIKKNWFSINSVIQQNAVRYWLLAIMKFFPQGIEQLQCSLANREMNSKNLMVAILLMRMARNHKGYLLDFKVIVNFYHNLVYEHCHL